MIVAEFEKVSIEQFNKDLNGLDGSYDEVKIPCRATSGSAGYDFYSPVDIVLKPMETVKIPTGIRCKIKDGYVLSLYPRSSLGFKFQMALLNTTGIIDSDYYNADNEGHIIAGIINRGDKNLVIKKGDRFIQGLFTAYYLALEEENTKLRHGGFGSTD